MKKLENKIDFVGVIAVSNANPNGDPLNGNRPRVTDDGYGEISDVCLKRKIRNRLMEMGESVFVQSDDNKVDGFNSLRERVDNNPRLKEAGKNKEAYAEVACETWIDVRAFGQVFAFKAAKEGKGDGVSIGIRGPISIQSAFSVDPVIIETIQITKSVNSETSDKKGPETMGLKHRVGFGVYLVKGSINVQLAERTGFSEEDANLVKEALITLFANDASSARPEGSMDMKHLYWFRHSNKLGQYPPLTVHESIEIRKRQDIEIPQSFADYELSVKPLEGLNIEHYEGYTRIQ